MTIRDFFSFKHNSFFWCNLLGMAVLVCLIVWGAFKWLDSYTHHGEALVVPDVTAMSVEEAERVFGQHQMVAVVADSNYVSERPAGVVLDQSPVAGQRVKRGRRVYLTINTRSVPMVNVPDVADNSSVRQAEARLIAAGFKLTGVEWIAGEKDWVYGVKCKEHELMPGEQVPRGAVLTLMVGDGSDGTARDSLATDSVILQTVEPMDDVNLDETWF